MEWGEIDLLFGRTSVSKSKAFITERKDNYRPPYGRKMDILNEERKYCLWGTTNEQELLADPTGNRRFWLVEMKQKCDLELIRSLRDDVWAEAVQAYLAGELWYLTEQGEALVELNNRNFLQSSVWDVEINRFLYTVASGGEFLIDGVFNFLEFPKPQRSEKVAREIGKSLRKRGCTYKDTTRAGRTGRYWFKPTLEEDSLTNDSLVLQSLVESLVAETLTQSGKPTTNEKIEKKELNF